MKHRTTSLKPEHKKKPERASYLVYFAEPGSKTIPVAMPDFYYDEGKELAALKIIESKAADYFSGDDKEEQFNEFKKLAKEIGLTAAINTSTAIFAKAVLIQKAEDLV
jgi:hypothetical protein